MFIRPEVKGSMSLTSERIEVTVLSPEVYNSGIIFARQWSRVTTNCAIALYFETKLGRMFYQRRMLFSSPQKRPCLADGPLLRVHSIKCCVICAMSLPAIAQGHSNRSPRTLSGHNFCHRMSNTWLSSITSQTQSILIKNVLYPEIRIPLKRLDGSTRKHC